MPDKFNIDEFLKSLGCNCCYEHKMGLPCPCHVAENKVREKIAQKIEGTCVQVVVYGKEPCSRCAECARHAREAQ